MKAHLLHLGEERFRTQAEGGAEILFDAGGDGPKDGPSPMQGALMADIACTASDIVTILRKERVPFTSLAIDAEAERATESPRVFKKIHVHYRLRGNGLQESAVKRAIDLSSEKYCSVGVMLRRGGVEFVNTYEILPEE